MDRKLPSAHPPALVYVDVVDLVCTDGHLGQGLDDVVTLQHDVTLEMP